MPGPAIVRLIDADAVIANFNRWFDPQDPFRGSGTYEVWAENFGGFKGESTSEGQPKSIVDGIEKVDDLTNARELRKALLSHIEDELEDEGVKRHVGDTPLRKVIYIKGRILNLII